MQTYLQSPNALSNAEIAEVYSLAEQHNVGICLYGGTQSPSKGPAEWSASGSIFALRRFMKAVGFTTIPKPVVSRGPVDRQEQVGVTTARGRAVAMGNATPGRRIGASVRQISAAAAHAICGQIRATQMCG